MIGSDRYSSVFQDDKYIVSRKYFKMFGQEHTIYDSTGREAFWVKLKPWKLKEDIRIYTGANMFTEVLKIQARQIIDFSATYDVFDSDTCQKIGALKRRGVKSWMLRDEWAILDTADREVAVIKEVPLLFALRRFPVLSILFGILPQKYSGEMEGKRVFVFKQNWNPWTIRLNLDFTLDPEQLFDRRLGIAGRFCYVQSNTDNLLSSIN